MKWQASLHLNFVDFERALDSVYIWKLLGLYGNPEKSIRMIQALYRDAAFTMKEILRHVCRCMVSPLLLLIALKETTSHQRIGIRWKLTTVVGDLDYADRPFIQFWISSKRKKSKTKQQCT